jgi:excisionase family DNA binding protein
MKTVLDPEDIKAIAEAVLQGQKTFLEGTDKRYEDDALFDVQGLAEYLHVSKQWVYERTHLREIPHIKVQGLLRFRKREIDKWLNSHNVPSTRLNDGKLSLTRKGEVTS